MNSWYQTISYNKHDEYGSKTLSLSHAALIFQETGINGSGVAGASWHSEDDLEGTCRPGTVEDCEKWRLGKNQLLSHSGIDLIT